MSGVDSVADGLSGVRATILGCEGPRLSEAEKAFFRANPPYGFILFARNVENREQLRALTQDLRDAVGRYAPILVDQEGGRVQRMKAPEWHQYPAAGSFGRIYEKDPGKAQDLCRLNAYLLAYDLAEVGIDVDCVPSLDLPQPGANDVIGARAFSSDPETSIALAKAQLAGVADAGVTGVMKHMPGHGRAEVDTHFSLPRVETDLETLKGHDFVPFRAFSHLAYGMTCHLLFKAIDDQAPSTLSARVIETAIRGWIGFDGLLMTDDLSMEALGGDPGSRAKRAIAAGCDLILHCNGKMNEMEAVIANVPEIAGQTLERAGRADQERARIRDGAARPDEDAYARLCEGVGADWMDGARA